MSDTPEDAVDGGEELDLGEVDEAEGDGQEDDAAGSGEDGEDAGRDGGEDSPEGEGEASDVAPARSGRRSQSQRLRERLERTERELAEARGFQKGAEQFRQPQQPQVDHEAERVAKWETDNLPMMSAQEISAYYYNKGIQLTQRQMLMQQLQTEDRLDKRDYDQQARTSKVHSQYRDEVERVLATERQNGNLRASRDDILHRLVGRDALDRAARAAPGQRRAASRRVASQTTRPTGARGDGAAGEGRGKWGDPEFDEQKAREGLRKGIF